MAEEKKFNIMKLILGHDKINRADKIQIVILIILVLYFSFVILKLKEVI